MAALLLSLLCYEHLTIKPKKDKLSNILECIDIYKENHKFNQYSLLGVAAQQSLNDTMMEVFAFDTHLDIHKDDADNKSVLAVLANQNELIFLQINRFHKVVKYQRNILKNHKNINLVHDNIEHFQNTLAFVWEHMRLLDDDDFSKKDISSFILISKSHLLERFRVPLNAELYWDNYILVEYNVWHNLSNFDHERRAGLDGTKYLVIPMPVCDTEALRDHVIVWPVPLDDEIDDE